MFPRGAQDDTSHLAGSFPKKPPRGSATTDTAPNYLFLPPQVDVYYGRSIGDERDKSAPTVWIPHKQPMPLDSFYHITVRDLGGIIANTEKMRYNAQ